jgi:hypothetical protein
MDYSLKTEESTIPGTVATVVLTTKSSDAKLKRPSEFNATQMKAYCFKLRMRDALKA